MKKTQKTVLAPLALATSALVWCAVNAHAQSGPTITNQPTSQTNVAGTSVAFSVVVDGTGPFAYRWQFNGTDLPTNIITTKVGNGNYTYSGDGGAATNAGLWYPQSVAFDTLGSLYTADWGNSRIRKVDNEGIISTVAGNGTVSYSGDGGAATNAGFNRSFGAVPDAAGKLYIADTSNHRIRKVETNGIISTVAGNGTAAYSGDGAAATNASLNQPYRVALDVVGNLYIADRANHRIRRVDTNGVISTVAGNGTAAYSGDGAMANSASLNSPGGVALDTAGSLHIADTSNHRIRKVDTNGIITTVAGNGGVAFTGDGGAATNTSLYYPTSVAFDAAGGLYIADRANHRIRRVDGNGFITTVAGDGSAHYAGDGGPATRAHLYYPCDLTFDYSGNLYLADSSNYRIREICFSGRPTLALTDVGTNNTGNYTVVITSPYGSVTSAVATLTVVLPPSILAQPVSQWVLNGSNATLSVTATGTAPFSYSWFFNATNLVQSGSNASLIISNFSAGDMGQYLAVVANAYGTVTSQVATLAFPLLVTTQPVSQTNLAGTNVTFTVVVDGTGPFTYRWQFNGANLPNNVISTVAGNGNTAYAGDGGAATKASLNTPRGVAFDFLGNLYVADTVHFRIRKVDPSGIITTVAGNGSATYAGDDGAATNASLNQPYGVALDAFGNLYIADYGNNRIRKVDPNGIITTVAGKSSSGYSGDGGAATNASLNQPYGVALDAIGNLYIADYGNNRIRNVDTNGIISTVAGNGTGTYAGDGDMATNASLNSPMGVGCDALGSLYIADMRNQRIRKVGTNGIISTVAGNGTSTYTGDGGAATNASLNYPTGVAFDAAAAMYDVHCRPQQQPRAQGGHQRYHHHGCGGRLGARQRRPW